MSDAGSSFAMAGRGTTIRRRRAGAGAGRGETGSVVTGTSGCVTGTGGRRGASRASGGASGRLSRPGDRDAAGSTTTGRTAEGARVAARRSSSASVRRIGASGDSDQGLNDGAAVVREFPNDFGNALVLPIGRRRLGQHPGLGGRILRHALFVHPFGPIDNLSKSDGVGVTICQKLKKYIDP